MKTKKYLVFAVFVAVVFLSVGVATIVNAKASSGQNVKLGSTEVASALVVGIDKQDRMLTLIGSEGDVVGFEVGQQVKNFDQIRVGDHVKVDYYASVALYLGDQGTQPKNDAGLVVVSAPKGEKPARLSVGAVDVSAMVQGIDRDKRTVTLKGHNGNSNTIEVDKSIDGFDGLSVGDLIHARFTEAIAISIEKTKPEEAAIDASAMTLLFVQNARGISYDSDDETLTLEDVNPVVTFFSDRPYRIAGHITVPGFLKLWNEGEDSFRDDPPNANLSILEDGEVISAVVEIANPKFRDGQLSYEVVKVLEGDLPASGGICSLFIDGLLDGMFEGGAGRSGLRGAAGGALIGAISGDAGRGAVIGAGVGIIGGAISEDRQRQEAAQMQARTRVIYVPNPNGSNTPVTLLLVPNGWQGPRGEIYPTLPSVSQLKGVYGVR